MNYEVESKTFREWSNLGYKIIKGSKSESRNSEGVCEFTKKQVTRTTFSHPVGFYDEYDGEDSPYPDYHHDCGGIFDVF